MRFSIIASLSITILIFGCTKYETIPTNFIHNVQTEFPQALNDSLIVDGYFNNFSFMQEDSAKIYLNSSTALKNAKLGIYDINHLLKDYIKNNIIPQKITNIEPYKNGFGYQVTAQYIVPSNLKSGLYFLGRNIPFLVKNNSKVKAKIAVVHPSNTDIAYNNQGGMSYYLPSHQNRARVLSKERPWLFHENGNLLDFYRWISTLPYKIDYLCDEDMEDYSHLKDYELLIFAGHSEYWTRNARANFDKFVEADKNILMLSGNSMYWQVRYDLLFPKQQICYKYDAFTNDPVADILLKTGRWEDARLLYNPLNSIGGNYYTYGGFQKPDAIGFGGYKILKPQNDLFYGLNFNYNDVMKFKAEEYDGAKFIYVINPSNSSDAFPTYDNSETKFNRIQILAYDLAVPDYGGKEIHSGAIFALKRKSTSGVIINIGASNWCGEIMNNSIQKITSNAIAILQKKDAALDGLFLK